MLRAIRTQIKWEFVDDFEDLMITCSIGATYSPNNGHEYEELFKKADYCLYVAKEKEETDMYSLGMISIRIHMRILLIQRIRMSMMAGNEGTQISYRHYGEFFRRWQSDY